VDDLLTGGYAMVCHPLVVREGVPPIAVRRLVKLLLFELRLLGMKSNSHFLANLQPALFPLNPPTAMIS